MEFQQAISVCGKSGKINQTYDPKLTNLLFIGVLQYLAVLRVASLFVSGN